MKRFIQIILSLLILAGISWAGDVTVSLSGTNPLSVNIKGTSSNQEAGSISIYLYFCDDGVADLSIDNVNDDLLELTWGWGNTLRTQSIQTGSWSRGGHTFTRRLYYDNVDVGDQNDYWTTAGINALVCTFTTLGSGHAYIEVNGDGLADWSGTAHNVSYGSQDTSLPVELVSFSGRQQGSSIILEWITESETDNLGFVLERKSDNSDWTTIASYKTHSALAGQGTISSRTKYTFTDMFTDAKVLYYRLKDVDVNGTAGKWTETTIVQNTLPNQFVLYDAYPNPFNPQTRIDFELPERCDVFINIYNLQGQCVETIAEQSFDAGIHSVVWTAVDQPSGLYFIHLQAGAFKAVRNVVLLK